MSSSAFSTTLILPADGLDLVRGQAVRGGMRGPDLHHMFCDLCKTWVFTRVEAFGIVNLRATMLDAIEWFVPFMETYTSTKLPWVNVPVVHSYDTFPSPESLPDLTRQFNDWARERKWPAPGS